MIFYSIIYSKYKEAYSIYGINDFTNRENCNSTMWIEFTYSNITYKVN